MADQPRWKVIVVGAGGFGREVVQYVQDSFRREEAQLVGFLDDRADAEAARRSGLPLVGTTTGYTPSRDERFVMAIGDPTARASVARRLSEKGAVFLTIVHPRAYVASTATIGEGCIIAPFASVGAHATLREQVQVHFYASAAHDSMIGSFCALSPYSVVNGGGALEEGAFLGTRATVNPGKRVGAFAKVAAGSVVYHDVPAGTLAVGNPAKARPLVGFATGPGRHTTTD